MRRTLRPSLRLLPLLGSATLLGAACLHAGPAAAQRSNQHAPPPQQDAPRAQAPALPGLAGQDAAPVPASGNQNLSPNDMLFDAISRGDLTAARTAVSRGADLSARNALGLTPLDSAVDQGRKEIMFFLLSSRGSGRGADVLVGGSSLPPPPDAKDRAALAAAARAAAQENKIAASQPVRPVREAATGVSPKLWDASGGTPNPQAGFLGFNAGRPAGAHPASTPAAAEQPRRRHQDRRASRE